MHKLGGMLPTYISILLFFWLAEAYGKSSGAYLLFIIAEIMAIYSLKYLSPKAMIVQLSLPVFLAIICYLTDFSLFRLPEITDAVRLYLEPIMYFSVLLSCATIVWSYSQNTQKHFKEMEEAKEALQKKYEELEAANEELIKTNEELDRFVYSVSHDLRAPISSAMGLITLCQIDKPNIDKYLGLQEQSMNKLDSFIKDILNYSRNSRLEVTAVVLDLPKMIQENFEDLAYSQAAEDIQFEVEVRGENVIYSDEFRLNIILSNLISNAIRYRNPQAKPSLLRFEIETEAEGARILVKDNGLGISQQHIPK
ncbi:MAG: sensor histidine kinase, partial [Bacteroidia bacterium]